MHNCVEIEGLETAYASLELAIVILTLGVCLFSTYTLDAKNVNVAATLILMLVVSSAEKITILALTRAHVASKLLMFVGLIFQLLVQFFCTQKQYVVQTSLSILCTMCILFVGIADTAKDNKSVFLTTEAVLLSLSLISLAMSAPLLLFEYKKKTRSGYVESIIEARSALLLVAILFTSIGNATNYQSITFANIAWFATTIMLAHIGYEKIKT